MIRKDTDEALRILVYLAERRGETVSAARVSENLGVPRSFAVKILGRLGSAGLLETHAGRHGGFSFVHEPGDISMMDVIDAVQGAPLLNRCTAEQGLCPREGGCPIGARLMLIQKQLNHLLRQSSIADMLPQK